MDRVNEESPRFYSCPNYLVVPAKNESRIALSYIYIHIKNILPHRARAPALLYRNKERTSLDKQNYLSSAVGNTRVTVYWGQALIL